MQIVPPRITEIQPSRRIEAPMGSAIKLYCNVVTSPVSETRISWLRNGQIIAYGQTLYLDNIGTEDQGDFICRAENEAGYYEQTAYIYVLEGKYYC